jgi:hypothetical protein
MLHKAKVSEDLIAQIIEGWIQQDQEKEAAGSDQEPGFVGYYHHVDNGILDNSPAALVGSVSEALCLD